MEYVPILDRPEERSQYDARTVAIANSGFQSSIAPKNDRNYTARVGGRRVMVPILDRPEERSQSGATVTYMFDRVPILDRPEERSQSSAMPDRTALVGFQSSIAPKNDRNARDERFAQCQYRVPILDRPEERSQSPSQITTPTRTSVPILDRPEERSQSGTFPK